jgi:hypothetical protein
MSGAKCYLYRNPLGNLPRPTRDSPQFSANLLSFLPTFFNAFPTLGTILAIVVLRGGGGVDFGGVDGGV